MPASLSTEGQPRRSSTLGMVPAQRRSINVRDRGTKLSPSSHKNKLSRPVSASRTTTSTWPRLQHHAPPTHLISERGLCRGDLQAQCRGSEAAVGSSHCDNLEGYFYFWTFLRNSTPQTMRNSCHTSSFGHVDRAICGLSNAPT